MTLKVYSVYIKMSIHYTNLGNQYKPCSIWNVNSNSFLQNYELRNGIEYPFNLPKKEIQLISFDDTNMMPVIKLPEKKMNILLSWYDKCDSLLDIVDIDYDIPENISDNELNNILHKPFHKKNINLFKETYLPKYFEHIENSKKINLLEREIYDCSLNVCQEESYMKNNHLLCYNSTAYEKRQITLVDIGIIKKEEKEEKEEKEKEKKEEKEMYLCKCDSNNKETVKPYDRWLLYKDPFVNCQELVENASDIDINKKYICVLIHSYYLQTIVLINPSGIEIDLFKNHTEYGFIELFNYITDNEEIISSIETTFKNKGFDTPLDVTKSLDFINKIIESILNNNQIKNINKSEESIIKKHIIDNYTITHDPETRIKASTLLNMIVEYVLKYEEILGKESLTKVSDNGFKIRLATYLTDLGLQKKRYNDGYYYYGIVKKKLSFMQTNDILKICVDNRLERNLETFMAEREKLDKQIFKE
jgi:hypothetical protein